jgi:hypothetical protein
MSDVVVCGYKKICEIQILHHYWLDDGSRIFDSLPKDRGERDKLPAAERQLPTREQRLKEYDVRKFLTVSPVPDTDKKLKSLNIIFIPGNLGFTLAIPQAVKVPDGLVFEFLLTIRDADFYNYTALTLLPRIIHNLYYSEEKEVYRYKENIPVFSNLTGASRGADPDRILFLSKEIPLSAAEDKAEFLNLSGDNLLQLVSDQPGDLFDSFSLPAEKMPVFFNQDDYPAIVAPQGLAGVPGKGIRLNDQIPDNVYALIRISPENPINPEFSCITASKLVKDKSPVFQIRFRNRCTYWKYLDKISGSVKSESIKPLPLTAFGNAAESSRKPGPSAIKVKFDDKDPGKRIIRIYSEIYE